MPAPGLPSGHVPVGEHAAGAAVRSAGSIAGTINLASSIKAGPSDVLYIMAKSGKNTLAVKRIEKPSFPLAFEIGGGDAMMGGQPFEGPVDVVARLSRTGDAIPSKGDAEGTARAIKIPSRGVTVAIDSVRQ
jgi:cytochrome c-type biogenesis protein CcmH